MLAQFVSLAVAPGGLGAPDPLRFSLSTHTLEHMSAETFTGCAYERATSWGDRRPNLTKQHPAAEAARRSRNASARTARVCVGRASQSLVENVTAAIQRTWARY